MGLTNNPLIDIFPYSQHCVLDTVLIWKGVKRLSLYFLIVCLIRDIAAACMALLVRDRLSLLI